jgi:predicted transposase/invertase (TIGR01784 family)
MEKILELVEKRSCAGILYLLLKYQGTKMFKEKLPEIFRAMLPLLQEQSGQLPLSGFLHYILYETDSSLEEVIRLFRQQLPQGDDAMLSTAEQLIQKGREQEKLEYARRMLNDNMDIALIAKYTGLSREEIEKLR